MPILVKDFTWTQTLTAINIKVPVSPVSHDKVDLFTSDCYIKAHFSPFLLELFLLHDIDNSRSKCIIKEDLIILQVIKREKKEWKSLEKELTKAEKMKIKQDVLEKCREQAQKEAEDRRIKKSELDRFTVRQAMSIDEQQHRLMDSRRDKQRKLAMDTLEEWKAIHESGTQPLSINETDNKNGVKVVELPSGEDEKISAKMESKEKPQVKTKTTKRSPVKGPIKIPVRSEYVEKKKIEVAERVLPRMRKTALLEITHTPRTFPTPSRESTAEEEEAWLKNITLARRATGFLSEDLRPEEQDPQWCKEKGDEFFRSSNFLGAISAYTHGITLSDRLPSLFANRAATHFALGNFHKCVNDCSTALDLLKPHCEGNRRSRAKCIARRGAALARLGYLNKGIEEMKAASKLLPEDEGIQTDIYNMEKAWEQNPDSD